MVKTMSFFNKFKQFEIFVCSRRGEGWWWKGGGWGGGVVSPP